MRPRVQLTSPRLWPALLAVVVLLPAALAVQVTFPIEPYWRTYLLQEADTIMTIGEQIDNFQARRRFACPLGGPEDIHMPPDAYPRSLTFLLRVLVNVWQNFGAAIDRMSSPPATPTVARAELRRFGFASVEQAEGVRRTLADYLKDFVDLRNQITMFAWSIDRVPGHTFPVGIPPFANIQALALMIEDASVVNGNVTLDTDGRRAFINMFKRAYDTVGEIADEAADAANDMRTLMLSDAFDALVTDRDPFAERPGNPQQPAPESQIIEEEQLVPYEDEQNVQLGDQIQLEEQVQFEPEDQPIGPWQADDEEIVLETSEIESFELDEAEADGQRLEWTVPGIFDRIETIADCWEQPLWDIYDLVLNMLGPIPDLSPPTWTERVVDIL
ncbi:hypothetical protein Dda_7144 [Drechslerella dactyloides]|uniref:Uncharacterized protein n=1 Tax=Drechslerella dactyloides TaxID=74499 RepID=A0AAD6IV78_DREDA|nr:hypothetical protein Dda_7144 [Drechslerella dactyloides]